MFDGSERGAPQYPSIGEVQRFSMGLMDMLHCWLSLGQQPFVCSSCGKGDYLGVRWWAWSNDCLSDKPTLFLAAKGIHLGVLERAQSNGCPWDELLCCNTAGGRHRDVLQWVWYMAVLGMVPHASLMPKVGAFMLVGGHTPSVVPGAHWLAPVLPEVGTSTFIIRPVLTDFPGIQSRGTGSPNGGIYTFSSDAVQ